MLKKITIVGLGMMGASIALAAKKKLGVRVCGVVRKDAYVKKALHRRIADDVHIGFRKSDGDSDIVILCVPVSSLCSSMDAIKPFLGPRTLVTDIGSVKQEVMSHAQKSYGRQYAFIGSHPMCGSEKAGMDFAKADLFEGATCIITPLTASSRKDVKKISFFWKSLGCLPIHMSADKHDKAVALVSHLPHLLSSVLMSQAGDSCAKKSLVLHAAGTGFKDMTRLAGGSPELWADIFVSNRRNIAASARSFAKTFESAIRKLEKSPRRDIVSLLEKGNQSRNNFESLKQKISRTKKR